MQTDVGTEFPEEYRATPSANGTNNTNKIFTNIAWVWLELLKMTQPIVQRLDTPALHAKHGGCHTTSHVDQAEATAMGSAEVDLCKT
jgi:hypothetical protein